MKPKVPNQCQHLMSNRILAYVKVVVLLRHILSRLLHGSGHILVIIHLWIIVERICNHTIFNILLCTSKLARANATGKKNNTCNIYV